MDNLIQFPKVYELEPDGVLEALLTEFSNAPDEPVNIVLHDTEPNDMITDILNMKERIKFYLDEIEMFSPRRR